MPTVAAWLWEAFWRAHGHPLDDVTAFVAAGTAEAGPPQCFVAMAGDDPAGTASFAHSDLDERPDLTPWLAGVFVRPEFRGRGIARQLVAAVETACTAPVLWLYTTKARGLYDKIGWEFVEAIDREGKLPAIVMRRLLHPV